MTFSDFDSLCMLRALDLARRGEGRVEPNPLVGCVIARDGRVLGEGFHGYYGGPHAEIEALRSPIIAGATLYVTLEPCCHHGKTPPCTDAIFAAGISRVVLAQLDPFPQVAGQGKRQLEAAGVHVDVGLHEPRARGLNAPYLKLLATGRPWIIAKWAMTLDGQLATRTGDSRWISGEASRAVAHALRGRVDAIVVGSGTVLADDPRLTARPAGPRTATRVVLDSRAQLATDSQLVRTRSEAPVLVAVSMEAPAADRERLSAAGCEVLVCDGQTHGERLEQLLAEFGRRRMTNVLVEGGSRVLGTFFDQGCVDEVHAFVAPKLIGGGSSPVAGVGWDRIADARRLEQVLIERLEDDVHIQGRVARN